MKKLWIILFVIFVGAGVFIYLQDESTASPHEAIAHRIGTGQIYEEIDVPKGRLIFYSRGSSINADFVKKSWNGWKWGYGGGHTIPVYKQQAGKYEHVDFSSQYFSSIRGMGMYMPYPMLFGVITNPDVAYISVLSKQTGDNFRTAILSNGRDPYRIWFLLLDEVQGKQFEISAVSSKHQILDVVELDEGSSPSNQTIVNE
ncbi:hypothetical protein [Paenibacillus terrigena]|uniref:hypothetical protein n=1 Tax=Paenibacillus terrigena TaxID=369333 RepID=UPI0028D1A803|nr:hypothetical protein [Paenibacillus terrigena]